MARRRTRLALGLLVTLLAAGGCGSDASLSAFVDGIAADLGQALPGATIEAVDELTLRVAAPGGASAEVRLDSAWAAIRNDPASREQVTRDLVASVVEALAAGERVDLAKVVPVVRERSFVAAAELELGIGAGSPADDPDRLAWEPLGGPLVVVYAEELANGSRYLRRRDLATAGLEPSGLRELAAGNLRRLLPAAIEIHDLDGGFMVTAGGSYEASLVLLGELWTRDRFPVAGDFVVAVPAADVLLVTGTEERRGLAKVRRSAGIAHRRGAHPIAEGLFLRRDDGLLEPFTPP